MVVQRLILQRINSLQATSGLGHEQVLCFLTLFFTIKWHIA